MRFWPFQVSCRRGQKSAGRTQLHIRLTKLSVRIVHIERIYQPVLERCGRFPKRVQSWEPHVDGGTSARPLYGTATSDRESAP